MNDFTQMHIFFYITTVVVVFWGVLGVVVLYYVIRVLKYIERLSRTVAEEADEIRDDIADVRARVREEGVRFKHILEFFSGALARPPRRTRKSD